MTSNEIAVPGSVELTSPGLPDPSDRALERIEKQARAMAAAHQLGSALAGTDMVPRDYKGKPDNATAAILYGAELGLSAIQSLQNVFIVHGKPAMYARTMVALAINAGHQVGEIASSAESVTWFGKRGDTGQEFTAEWTIDRAKQAEYLSNALYKKQPVEMLRAKAQTEVCRTLFADVLLGMAYSVEDLELEGQPIRAKAERVTAGPKRGMAGLADRLGVSSADADPEPGEEAGTAEDGAPAAKPATAADIKKLDAALTNAGIVDQAERRTFLSGRVGRELQAAREMTRNEITAVIEFIENGEPVADADPQQ
ncbi:hypothetical protein GS462_21670 [Rhodococcus hoagii]|nr:hypothetical protein [Prescottella equi]MBM4527230.1 hypothetical protein [Prescottella equi]MBM4653006.1 hypothetical protein [Prescottella equi]MBM4687724.1 hypothetical protein [Prescottella equi]